MGYVVYRDPINHYQVLAGIPAPNMQPLYSVRSGRHTRQQLHTSDWIRFSCQTGQNCRHSKNIPLCHRRSLIVAGANRAVSRCYDYLRQKRVALKRYLQPLVTF